MRRKFQSRTIAGRGFGMLTPGNTAAPGPLPPFRFACNESNCFDPGVRERDEPL
jgi:hypothetical protein